MKRGAMQVVGVLVGFVTVTAALGGLILVSDHRMEGRNERRFVELREDITGLRDELKGDIKGSQG